MSRLFNCPECGSLLKLPDGFASVGDTIECPNCTKPVKVPANTASSPHEMPTVIRSKAQSTGDKKPLAGNMFFECPECHGMLKLPPDIARPGNMVDCPRCAKKIKVPAESQKDAPKVRPAVIRTNMEKRSGTANKISAGKKLIIAVSLPALLIVSAVVFQMIISRIYADKISHVIETLENHADVSCKEMKVGLFGKDVEITGVAVRPHGSPQEITVGRLVLNRLGLKKGMPDKLKVYANEVMIPMCSETFGPAGPAMQKLGYNCISANAICEYQYDKNEKSLYLKKLSAMIPQAGNLMLSLSVHPGDMEPASTNTTFKSVFSSFPSWRIIKGEFEYSDDGFIGRFLDYQAEYIGETSDELYVGMLADLDKVIQQEQDSFTRQSLQEFRKFVSNSRYVKITADPVSPISIARLNEVYDEKGVKGLIPELKLLFSVGN